MHWLSDIKATVPLSSVIGISVNSTCTTKIHVVAIGEELDCHCDAMQPSLV